MLCDEIAIMDHGKIIAQGSPENLLKAHFNDAILQIPANAIGDTSALAYPLHKHNSVIEITTSDVNQAIKDLLAHDISLSGLQIRSRNLDDLFLELTGKSLRS